MKILITGGAGYIGSHTVHFLIQNGIQESEIIVFDNLKYGNKQFLPKNIKFIHGDLLNKSEVNEVFKENKIDSVIHFAAYAYVGESMQSPSKYFENNIQGGVNLLEAMRVNNCFKIIFSSTCAVYGIPPLNSLISESLAPNPINPYGESKLMFEKILKWYREIFSINSVALRYFNASGADFGIGEKHIPETHVLPLAIQSVIQNLKFSVYGNDYDTFDGTCIRDYIHVADLASAHYKALNFLDSNNGNFIFNIGTGQGYSIMQVVNEIEKVSGKRVNLEFAKRRNGDPAVLIANNEKAMNELNWFPNKTLSDIIYSAWNWHILNQ